MEWHRAQLVSAKVLPRCSAGDMANAGDVSISVTSVWPKANRRIADRPSQLWQWTNLDRATKSSKSFELTGRV